MGKGRKPLPDAVKQLRGTDQPCRMSNAVDGAEKITDVKKITTEAKLRLLPTKRAKDIFKTKANQLIALGVLTSMDLEHLAVYCNSLDVLFDCMEGMREPAIEKHNKNGDIVGYVARPEIAMYKQMVDNINRLGSEFGFTPLSRQKVNQQEVEVKNPFMLLAESI